MKTRLMSVAAGVLVLVASATVPATASSVNEVGANDGETLSWLEEAPEFPIEREVSVDGEAREDADALTSEDIEAIAAFQAEFPWEEAFASYGCVASDIAFGDDGGKSMQLDCAESSVDFDDVLKIPSTAVAAAEGEPEAIAAILEGRVVAPTDVTAMAIACGITGNQRHCLNMDAGEYLASSLIRTVSGSSTGVNRLGRVGVGNACANGTFLADSIRLSISTTVYSYVDSPSTLHTQYSSRWTMSPFSYSRYCAVV